LRCLKRRMKTLILAVMFTSGCIADAQTLIACSCEVPNTVCLSDIEVSEHAVHVEMAPDLMGHHSNYAGVAVFQIGFDERGRVTGASTISGHPLGISHLIEAASKWRFKPVVVKGVKKKGCGKLSIEFAMRENVPSAKVLRKPAQAVNWR
jgi:hypothetical protein